MKVKRFVAADMRRALDLVKQEMGPDAVILSTSRTKQGVEVLTSLAAADQWSDLPKKVANDSEFSRKKSSAGNGISLSALKGKKFFNGGRDVDDVDEAATGPLQSDVAWGSASPFGRLMEKQYQQAAGEQQPQHRTDTIRPSQYRPFENQYANEGRSSRAPAPRHNVKRYEISADEDDFVEQDRYVEQSRYVDQNRYADEERYVDYGQHNEGPNKQRKQQVNEKHRDSSDDLERAAMAHQNLQAAMADFEKAYQAIKSASKTEAKSAENSIDNHVEFDQRELRSQYQSEPHVQQARTIAQPLAERERASQSVEAVAPISTKVVEGKITEKKLTVESDSEKQNHAQPSDSKPEVETQGAGSWWNSAFQFSSYQVNYNPEYQLYLPSYDEPEQRSNVTSQSAEKNSAVIQMQQDLQDVKAVLQGESVSDTAIANSGGSNKTNINKTIAAKAPPENTNGRRTLIDLLKSIKDRNQVDNSTDVEDDHFSEIDSIKSSKKRPMFTLVETPKVQPETSESLFSESLLKSLQQPASAELQSLISEIADMRELLQTQLDRLAQQSTPTSGAGVSEMPLSISPIKATLKRRLFNLGLAATEIDKLLAKVDLNAPLNEVWTEVLAVLAHQLPIQGSDIVDKGGFFAFVGSPGCGKTTTISKLAARYVLKHGAKGVAIVSMASSSSLSNNNSLKRLGQILKIPVHKVGDIKHLRYQLDELCEYKLVLIDTAGLRYGDPALRQQLSVLRQLPQVKNILVLAANTQLQLMKASVHAFRAADLCACVLTKVDDTISLGEAFSAALQEKLPIAYTSSGQDFTKDIQVARAHQVVARAVSLLKTESKRQLRLQVENTRKPALLNR